MFFGWVGGYFCPQLGVRKQSVPVIASAAKQSILSAKQAWDCFVATLLAMT